MYRIFLNFAKSCILSCLSKFYMKKFHRAVFEHNTLVLWVTPESIILNFSSIIRQTLITAGIFWSLFSSWSPSRQRSDFSREKEYHVALHFGAKLQQRSGTADKAYEKLHKNVRKLKSISGSFLVAIAPAIDQQRIYLR